MSAAALRQIPNRAPGRGPADHAGRRRSHASSPALRTHHPRSPPGSAGTRPTAGVVTPWTDGSKSAGEPSLTGRRVSGGALDQRNAAGHLSSDGGQGPAGEADDGDPHAGVPRRMRAGLGDGDTLAVLAVGRIGRSLAGRVPFDPVERLLTVRKCRRFLASVGLPAAHATPRLTLSRRDRQTAALLAFQPCGRRRDGSSTGPRGSLTRRGTGRDTRFRSGDGERGRQRSLSRGRGGHEVWGLNRPTRTIAEDLAAAGYVARSWGCAPICVAASASISRCIACSRTRRSTSVSAP